MIWNNITYFKNDLNGPKEKVIKSLITGAGLNDEIFRQIMERENEYTSAVGKGVSFVGLHKTEEKPHIIVGVSKKGIDFNAFDGVPVKIIIIFIGGKDKTEYVEIVSSILSLLNQRIVRNNILSATSQQELGSLIKKEETNEE